MTPVMMVTVLVAITATATVATGAEAFERSRGSGPLAYTSRNCTFQQEVDVLCTLHKEYPFLWDEDPCNFTMPCQTPLLGVTCYTDETKGHVQSLSLTESNLGGSFPECVTGLCYLHVLDLADTKLHGTIPEMVGNLTQLLQLCLQSNLFTGSIPSSIGNMGNLQYLDVHSNDITGVIPSTISGLTSLRYLDVSFNDFNGSFPDTMESLTQLQYLDFSYNELSGEITEHFCKMVAMQCLFASYNDLSGSLPSSLGNMKSLVLLKLDNNGLSGQIPSSIGNFLSLQYLGISHNSFTGSIPSSLGNVTNLQILDMSYNSLEGDLPDTLLQLKELYYLDISSNFLNSTLTYFDTYLQTLGFCNLSTNCISCESPHSCYCNSSLSSSMCTCIEAEQGCYIEDSCYVNGHIVNTGGCKQTCNTSLELFTWIPASCPSVSEDSGLSSKTIGLVSFCIVSIVITSCVLTCVVVYSRKSKKEEAKTLLPKKSLADLSVSCNTPEEFPLKLSQTVVDLGERAPVGIEVTQAITITNPAKTAIKVKIVPPQCNKIVLVIQPASKTIRSGGKLEVLLKIKILCTTTIDADAHIFAEKSGETLGILPLRIQAVAEMSTSIDMDHILLDPLPIGEGGYGVVYRGKWEEQDVAVKILKNQEGHSIFPEFEKEVKAMEMLRCPQIVHFVGAVRIPGSLAIVTEFSCLGSLRSCMKKYKMAMALKMKCLLDCARGMVFLHKSHMFSMDENQDVNCKITDFGYAREVVRDRTTQCYSTVGTPIYMAPELLLNGKYNKSADVFSFGVLGYELLTEKEPYAHLPTIWRIIQFVIDGHRLSLDGIPAPLQELVGRCWAQDSRSRPTFLDVCTILENLIQEGKM
ncbi:GPCR kinase [Pelomyxa schiedti]|nr:GPCR kinase [Pelomyxa schiedti]